MTRRNDSRRNRLCRSTKNRVFLGVCGGIADYFDFNVTALRVLVVVLTLLTWIAPALVVYLISAMVMKPAPARAFDSVDEEDFYYTVKDSPQFAVQRIRRRFDRLDKRLQRMESIVTSPTYDLKEQYRNL